MIEILNNMMFSILIWEHLVLYFSNYYQFINTKFISMLSYYCNIESELKQICKHAFQIALNFL